MGPREGDTEGREGGGKGWREGTGNRRGRRGKGEKPRRRKGEGLTVMKNSNLR